MLSVARNNIILYKKTRSPARGFLLFFFYFYICKHIIYIYKVLSGSNYRWHHFPAGLSSDMIPGHQCLLVFMITCALLDIARATIGGVCRSDEECTVAQSKCQKMFEPCAKGRCECLTGYQSDGGKCSMYISSSVRFTFCFILEKSK